MRTQKWFFLPSLVILTVWIIISIWAMDKVGVLEIVQREYATLKMVGLRVKEPERPLFIMNTYFHAWGHRFLYDRQTLQSALESVDFETFASCVMAKATTRNYACGAAYLRDWE